jgi:hypothetical protein
VARTATAEDDLSLDHDGRAVKRKKVGPRIFSSLAPTYSLTSRENRHPQAETQHIQLEGRGRRGSSWPAPFGLSSRQQSMKIVAQASFFLFFENTGSNPERDSH